MRFLLAGLALAAVLAQDLTIAPRRRVKERPDAREQYFMESRRTPDGRAGGPQRLQALSRLEAIRRAPFAKAPAGRRLAGTAWTLIGPQPAGGVNSGRVPAMVVDPRNADVVYIGAADGGIWKTVDGGGSWKPLTDNEASMASGALVLDPLNPDIVYAGTGEQSFSGDSYYGAGILKSTDGGATWVNHVGPFLRTMIGGLAIHPTRTNVLLAATSRSGLYRSTDAGENWTLVLTAGVNSRSSSVIFSPDGAVAYASLQDSGARNGVYKSVDAGETWTLVNGTAPSAITNTNTGRIEMAMAPSQPDTLYVAVASTETGRSGTLSGVYKTVDGGARWTKLAVADICAPQCWYNLVLAVHPTDPENVWFGGLRHLRSLDGGATWAALGTVYHVDQHQISFSKDGGRVYIGNDGGVWSTTDVRTAPVNWRNHNETLAVTQFYPGHSIHPTDVTIGLGGTQDNNTQRYSGRLAWTSAGCGDGGWTAFDPARPANFFGTCQNIDIRRNLNGATAFNAQIISGIDDDDRKRFIPPFIMDPADAKRLYFGTMRVYRSLDTGGVWTPISGDLAGGTATLSTLAVAPSDANVMMVGASNGRLWTTRNLLAESPQWQMVPNTAGLPARFLNQVRVDPIDSRVMYAVYGGFAGDAEAVRGHVFRSRDGGGTWEDLSGNLPNIPVNDLVIDPDLAGTFYISTDAGVMFSGDGGVTWADLGTGLPRCAAVGLALHRPTRTLRVATHGRSMWDFELGAVEGARRPVIETLDPARVAAGAAEFTLAIRGSGFVPGATVRWNGAERTPVSVAPTLIQLRVPAADVARLGRADVAVFNPVTSGGLSYPADLVIGDAPATTREAIVSAAFPTGGSDLVPGSLATLFGTNLAAAVVVSPQPLARALGGFSRILSTTPAPLLFVAPGQTNFQVPWFVNINQPVETGARLIQGTQVFDTRIRLVPYKPAIFSTNQSGAGQGAITISGTGLVAAPAGAIGQSRPARRGEFIEIYATGLGAVTNTPFTGDPATANPLSRTTTTPVVTIGERPARVIFAGLAPGFIGLYQVNTDVPADAPTGEAVPVVLTIGGVASNGVTIAVQ